MQSLRQTEFCVKVQQNVESPDGSMESTEAARTDNQTLDSRFFNTNNLWVDLAALKREFKKNDGALPLPVMKTPGMLALGCLCSWTL